MLYFCSRFCFALIIFLILTFSKSSTLSTSSSYKVAPLVSINTEKLYLNIVETHAKKLLPNVPLRALSGLEIHNALNKMVAGSRTQEMLYNFLLECLKMAREIPLMEHDPMRLVKIPPHKQKKGQALTTEEKAVFLKTVKGHKLENYFKFVLYTGCRRQEALDFCWSDLYLEKNEI